MLVKFLSENLQTGDQLGDSVVGMSGFKWHGMGSNGGYLEHRNRPWGKDALHSQGSTSFSESS
jgi:hypothetical protein